MFPFLAWEAVCIWTTGAAQHWWEQVFEGASHPRMH